MRARRWLIMPSLIGGLAMQGCVAVALLPAASALVIGKQNFDRWSTAEPEPAAAAVVANVATPVSAMPDASPGAGDARAELTGLSSLPAPGPVGGAPGSADAAAARPAYSPLGYEGLTRHVFAAAQAAGSGEATHSVILMPGADPLAPEFTVCGELPPAMVVNLDSAMGAASAAPTRIDPRLIEAATVAGMAGVETIFTSHRGADAQALAAALDGAGLGPIARERNLWLVGDRASSDADSLRWKIASNWCVVAMVGDEPRDFTRLFETTGAIATSPALLALRDKGWFVLPAPFASNSEQRAAK